MVLEALGALLHKCSKTRALRVGIALHAAVVKTGVGGDMIVSNHVLNMYGKCGRLGCARQLFDEMPDRNVVTWSAMISGYEQWGEDLMALEVFRRLQFVPTEYVFASAITASANVGLVMCGRQLHAQSLKVGEESVAYVRNSLISMYMKCSCHDDALRVYLSGSECNLVTYNVLIKGFAVNLQWLTALEVFKHMCQDGILPDQFTFLGILGVCTSSDDMHLGLALHCQSIKLRHEANALVGNAIIVMYCNSKMIDDAEKAFHSVVDKDIITWNSIVSACCQCEDHIRGLKIFREMTMERTIWPDNYTFSGVLAVCAMVALTRHGKEMHAHLIRITPSLDLGVLNALVNMYAKCGCLNQAFSIFNSMPSRNLVTWNTMISGLANHGFWEKAYKVFMEMKFSGVKPDAVTFMGVLIACNHAGLVKEGQHFFNSMENSYGIQPDLEHFSCLIDLLGRAGKFEDAEEYMSKSPFRHDPVILGSLLSACLVHGNVQFGLKVAVKLLNLRPSTASLYVLLSKCFALWGMWESVAEVRKVMEKDGLKKEPGHSLIEVHGNVERFTMGEFAHSEHEQIEDMLELLSCAVAEIAES